MDMLAAAERGQSVSDLPSGDISFLVVALLQIISESEVSQKTVHFLHCVNEVQSQMISTVGPRGLEDNWYGWREERARKTASVVGTSPQSTTLPSS